MPIIMLHNHALIVLNENATSSNGLVQEENATSSNGLVQEENATSSNLLVQKEYASTSKNHLVQEENSSTSKNHLVEEENASTSDELNSSGVIRLCVLGGGGNCFSFGTHLNRQPIVIDLRLHE